MTQLIILNLVILSAVIFVNGFTDAPNAIATTVTTGVMKLKNAVFLSSVMNFSGVVAACAFKPAVVSNLLQMFSFDSASLYGQIALCGAMMSVVIWSILAWCFGIPTSESHALLSGLVGAELAVFGENMIHFTEVLKFILTGIILSSVVGMFCSALLSMHLEKITANNTHFCLTAILQKILAAVLSFLHGAQDGQKLLGVGLLILQSIDDNDIHKALILPSVLFCSAIMGIGTVCSGKKIITTIGEELFLPNNVQAVSTDIAACIGIALSTYFGLPVSTTTTKTMAIIGASLSDEKTRINKKTALEIITTWLITLPVCCFISFVITKVMVHVAK